MIGSELALRDDVSLLDLADQPLVARQLKGISDARERLATVAAAARTSSKVAVEGARVVKITPDRTDPVDQGQGSAWNQQWFATGLLGSDDEGSKTQDEVEGIGTPEFGSDKSPEHRYDCDWTQLPSFEQASFEQMPCYEELPCFEPPALLQVPMVCTPWGLTPMMVCLSETSGTDHMDQDHSQLLEDVDSEKYWWKRRRGLVDMLARFLTRRREYGCVPLDDVLQRHPQLWYKCHSAHELARVLAQVGELSPIVVDLLHCTVRLRTTDEALVATCEMLMAELEDGLGATSAPATLSLNDALKSREVQSLAYP